MGNVREPLYFDLFTTFFDLYDMKSTDFSMRFWLFYTEPFHQPSKLLPCDRFRFDFIFRPLKTSAFQSFV